MTYSVGGSGQGTVEQDVTPVEAGVLVNTTFPAPDCGHLTFLVRAVDAQGMHSADSNGAKVTVPCAPTTSIPSTTSSSSTGNPSSPSSSTARPTPSFFSSEETPTASSSPPTTTQSGGEGDGCSCVSTDTLVTAVIGSVVGSILALFLVELLVYVLVKLFQRRRWKKRQRQRELGRSTRGVENMAMDYADSGGNHESRFGKRRRRFNDGTPTNGQGEVASTASTPLPYLGQSTTSINHAGRPVLPSHNNQRLLPQGYSSPQDQYGNPRTDSHNSRGNVQYSQYHEQPQTQQYNQYNYRPQNQNRRGYTPDEYM